LRSRKIQSDVPTASLLASKARGLNLVVFAKHRLKANNRVNLCESVSDFFFVVLRALRGEKIRS